MRSRANNPIFTWMPKFTFDKGPILLGSNTSEGEYMWRWNVAKWLGWSLKFHCFMSSDQDDFHDHPWWFISILLAGSYVEHYEAKDGSHQQLERRAPSICFRRAEHRHSVHLEEGPCLTLVLSGSVKRQWGFWPLCQGIKKFVYWRDYLYREAKGEDRCG